MKRLFVLSGGGPAGIDIHVGMLTALKEANIIPDFWSGTSAGAVVSSLCATNNFDTKKLISVVKSLTNDILAYRTLWFLREAWLDSMMSNEPLIKMLHNTLPLVIPPNINIWATRCTDRAKVNIAKPSLAGDLPTAVLASLSIHGIWPVVKLLDGNDYTDGGFRFNTPFDDTIYLDFDEVWILIACGKPEPYHSGETNLIKILRDDISWLLEDKTLDVLDKYSNNHKIKFIWPMLDSPSLSFDHSLINKSYEETKKQITNIIMNVSDSEHRMLKKMLINSVRMLRHA